MNRPSFHRFRALGCTAVVGASPDRLDRACEVVSEEVAACDLACSRFRDDSELAHLNREGFVAHASEWLRSAVSAALHTAEATSGLVDPTIGQTLIDLGYDRTFEDIQPGTPLKVIARHVPAWRSISVDDRLRTVRIPSGTRIDLGATAKALCADRAATRAAESIESGVLVSLGGDIAVAGAAPDEGWIIRVTDRADREPDDPAPGQTVAIRHGGLATSGITARQWTRSGQTVHHLLDPRTASPAHPVWCTVSVAAPTCLAANTASTAAIIFGADAIEWLEGRGYDARLVAPDGDVRTTGAWPAPEPALEVGA